ncbi:MAG: stage II sporulation protein M [Oscillospiraceae bacterium]|nr:stage II sporulation protein M [Oscillospiraceae bacterium]
MKGNQPLNGLFSFSRPFWEHVKNAAIAFIMLTVIGFLFGLLRSDLSGKIIGYYTEQIAQSGLDAENSAAMFRLIFQNNLSAAFLSLCLGFVPLCYLSAFPLGLNAVILGAFAAYYQVNGPGIVPFLAGTLPHAPFELTGLTIACAAGLYLCRVLTDKLRRRESPPLKDALMECMRCYALCVLPLLLLAAGIESYLTPIVLNWFL